MSSYYHSPELVTLVNRSSRALDGMWDGRTYTIQANAEIQVPVTIAEAIKRRNPIMGSDDPHTGQLQYLVGIKEQGDDCTPVEQSKEIELFSSQRLRGAVPVMIIPGIGGLYSRNEVAGKEQSPDTFFEKP